MPDQPDAAATGGDGSSLPGRCLCEPDDYVCDAGCQWRRRRTSCSCSCPWLIADMVANFPSRTCTKRPSPGWCRMPENPPDTAGSAGQDRIRGSAAWPLFCRGPRWFRIKGYGVRYVNHRRHPPFFSERNGYRRGLHIGPHCLMVVKP